MPATEMSIPEEQITRLALLAMGNLKLVEEAMLACMKNTSPWWLFWRKKWSINFDKAAEYIRDKTNSIGDDSSINNG